MNDWRDQARCRSIDGDLFFPLGHISEADKEQAKAAKQVCVGCPVRLDCLEWSIANGANWGIWGGLTEAERRALRRKRHFAGVR